MKDDYTTLLAYNRWADEQVINALRSLTPEQYKTLPAPDCRSVHSTLLHMADATFIWVRRIQGQTITTRVDESTLPTFDDAVRFLNESHDAVASVLATLPPNAGETQITYLDLQKNSRTLPLWVLLRHLTNHSSYHRGQLTARLIDAGIEPPLIDLVLWAMHQT
ncbi:MAG: DinB family protein [Armatimonas sp.]